MTPVEARKTSSGAASSASATARAEATTAASPAAPVNALALPALQRTARAVPRPTCSRHQSTGADAHRERVNTPATRDPGASAASITSGRPR